MKILSIILFTLVSFPLALLASDKKDKRVSWLAEDVSSLLKNEASLRKYGGGKIFDMREGKSVALAIGVSAEIKDFETARKIALTNAEVELAKLFGGAEISAKDESEISGNTSKDTSKYTTSVKNQLYQAKLRGLWIEKNKIFVALTIYKDVIPPQFNANLEDCFENIEIKSEWRDVLAKSPEIWFGGAKFFYNKDSKKSYIICVVSTKPKTNPAKENILFRTYAARDILKYTSGSSIQSDMSLYEEVLTTHTKDGEKTSVSSSFTNLSMVSVRSKIKSIEQVGTLLNKISGRKSALFILNLN